MIMTMNMMMKSMVREKSVLNIKWFVAEKTPKKKNKIV